MEAHPNIGILGGRMQYMDEGGRLLGRTAIIKGDLSIRWHLLHENPFNNPTVMMRKALLDRLHLQYEESASYGEDFDLTTRLLPETIGENIGDVLVHYRLHASSLTSRYAPNQAETSLLHVVGATTRSLPGLAVPVSERIDLQRALMGVSPLWKLQRARLMPVYFEIWKEFSRLYGGRPGFSRLQRSVLAWAGRLILYPPFQKGTLAALALLTRTDWKWPWYLALEVPEFLARRRIPL
jgi:hypothetical protein